MPVVTLKMGSSLNPEDIKEGDDVYFECNIRANPKAYKLSWFHNVSIKVFFHCLKQNKKKIKKLKLKITKKFFFAYNSLNICSILYGKLFK